MLAYAVKRTVTTVPIMLGVSVLVFLLMQLIPGNAAVAMLGPAAGNPHALAQMERYLGLNRPIAVQYLIWLGHLVHGNLGQSTEYSQPVAGILAQRVHNSLILLAASLLLSIVFGVLIGVVSASRPGSVFDRIAMSACLVLASAPTFWLGLLLLWFFAVHLRVFPEMGMYTLGQHGFFDLIRHLVLPALATAAIPIAVIGRLVRSSMLEVLSQPYVLALRTRGLSTLRVHMHAFRNVLVPTVNIVALQAGFVFGSALYTEVVFNWPGVGLLIYNALLARDLAVVQATVLVISLVFVVFNLAADLVRVAIDPRER